MKIGLLVQPLRGVVVIRGFGEGSVFEGRPVRRTVIDVQVVPLAALEEIRAGKADPKIADRLCQGFAADLTTLFETYGVEMFSREVQT